jgi:PleD family two-component response regulator
LLSNTDLEDAKSLAERARFRIEQTACECDSLKFNLTMTFGVAEYSRQEGIYGTIRKADMALLQGKQNGRNQVVEF